jgi:hypothetical protein
MESLSRKTESTVSVRKIICFRYGVCRPSIPFRLLDPLPLIARSEYPTLKRKCEYPHLDTRGCQLSRALPLLMITTEQQVNAIVTSTD